MTFPEYCTAVGIFLFLWWVTPKIIAGLKELGEAIGILEEMQSDE